MDPWCYPGEKTQSVVVLKSCLEHLSDKSRDAMRSHHQLTEESKESKSAFLLSSILIKKGQRSPENVKQSAAILPRKLPLRWQPLSTWASFQ